MSEILSQLLTLTSKLDLLKHDLNNTPTVTTHLKAGLVERAHVVNVYPTDHTCLKAGLVLRAHVLNFIQQPTLTSKLDLLREHMS